MCNKTYKACRIFFFKLYLLSLITMAVKAQPVAIPAHGIQASCIYELICFQPIPKVEGP